MADYVENVNKFKEMLDNIVRDTLAKPITKTEELVDVLETINTFFGLAIRNHIPARMYVMDCAEKLINYLQQNNYKDTYVLIHDFEDIKKLVERETAQSPSGNRSKGDVY